MARAICIIGESGHGKTTSLRNLDPKETYFIDADKKKMAWKGFRKQYNDENKNYMATNDPNTILWLLQNISDKAPHIKHIIIDTLSGVMVGEEMRRSQEKNYDKWVDLASYVYNIMDIVPNLRDDLIVIFTAHSDTERDDSGYLFTRMKTSGKKLSKIVPESKFNVVLLAKRKPDGAHVFITKSADSTAKTPLGMFDDVTEIPNDIMLVINELNEF